MTRVVSENITFFDKDSSEIKTIVINKESLSRENIFFILNLHQKNYDKLVKDMILYSLVIGSEFDSFVECVEDFQSFLTKFVVLYDFIEKKMPKRFNRIKKEINSYSMIKDYQVDVHGSFMEKKYEVAWFKTDDGKVTNPLQEYPLLPELAIKLFSVCNNINDLDKIETKLETLHCAIEYFKIMAKRDKTYDYEDMIKKVSEKLATIKNGFSEYNMYLSDFLTFSIVYEDNETTNVEKFAEYFIKKLIDDKMIDVINELKKILYQSDCDNPNYKFIVNSLLGLLSLYGYQDEYYCFSDMRKDNPDEYITHTFIIYFNTYYTSKECQDLINTSNNGEQRTYE